jgi:hypothetical protein
MRQASKRPVATIAPPTASAHRCPLRTVNLTSTLSISGGACATISSSSVANAVARRLDSSGFRWTPPEANCHLTWADGPSSMALDPRASPKVRDRDPGGPPVQRPLLELVEAPKKIVDGGSSLSPCNGWRVRRAIGPRRADRWIRILPVAGWIQTRAPRCLDDVQCPHGQKGRGRHSSFTPIGISVRPRP